MQILCFFSFLFLFKGSSKCDFFHLAVLFRFYRVLFLHHVFLSEQIKMMMMMMMIINKEGQKYNIIIINEVSRYLCMAYMLKW